jgi:frataxin-like iron-binding protein CyaY
MKVIKLTESELNRIVKRVLQTEQESEEEPDKNLVVGLRNFSKGRITKDELYRLDDSIYDIDVNEPLGQSIITIQFEDDKELFKELDIDEQDIWFMQAVNGYQGYEFMEAYQVEQDFKEGYGIYYDLNEENRETLKNIATTILPNKEFNIEDEEYKTELSEMLLNLFYDEMDYIFGDFAAEKDNEMNAVAKEAIKDEFERPLEENGINLNYDMDEVDITLADLYLGALQLNMFNSDAKEIIVAMMQKALGSNVGGWYENSYEFQDESKFDSKSFNNYVSHQFEKILEKLDERSDEGYTVQDFVEFRDRVTSKYKLKTWYTNPKDDNIIFLIDSFDVGSMSVRLNVKTKDNGLFKQLRLDEEQFNNFLYQYSLDDYENMN